MLAGGQGRRMGGVDKGLVELDGKPMVAHVLDAPRAAGRRAPDQRQPEPSSAMRHSAIRVVPDAVGGFAGPLAGLHAG